jgi:hypothetical protein
MKARFVVAATLMLFGLPMVAEASGIVGGAQQGARVGNRAAGPIGGAVGAVGGGVVGGVVGGVRGAIGAPQRTSMRRKSAKARRTANR